jgi:prepilin-type N-terminal cleavage/methylation domain-containing protein/prepilin-type processing-associated H-X9-DG protein
MSPKPGHLNRRPAMPRLPGQRFTLRAPRRFAFTLLELLVVIFIISLVLAMLVPSLAAARRQAQRVQCQSNLKQIVFGWHSYLVDSKGFFPRGAFMEATYGGLRGYLSNASPRPLNKHLGLPPVATRGGEVFRCPSDQGDRGTEGMYSPVDERPYFTIMGSSYMANPLLVGQLPLPFSPQDPSWHYMTQKVNPMLAGLNVSRISNESRLVLVGDGVWIKAWRFAWTPEAGYWHSVRRTHNIGFFDGHADFVEIRKGVSVASNYTVIPFASVPD